MKKEKVKVVEVCGQTVKVTPSTSQIFKIKLIYSGGIAEEEFYCSFRDEDDADRYCIEIADKKLCINVVCEFIDEVEFGGTEDEE